MTTYNEQKAMQGVATRFVEIADELQLSGAQLYRDGIVSNDQVLSKIKNGWQKPPKKAIELLCQKYGVSAAWLYTGDGNRYIGRNTALEPRLNKLDEVLFYNTDFASCLDSKGQPLTTGNEESINLPKPLPIKPDFWCINYDLSLYPEIDSGDCIALKRLDGWKDYIPGNFNCVVVTGKYKVLRKVAVTQSDNDSITFVQMVNGSPTESSIPKNIIIEIYKVEGIIRRMQ